MTVERALRLIAGFFVMLAVLLAAFHSRYWLILAGLVGLNLFQSAFTDWCPMVWVFQKLGLPRCCPQKEKRP